MRGVLPKFPHCAQTRGPCYGGESHRVAHAARIVQYCTIGYNTFVVGSRSTTGSRYRLGEPLASDLADYCAVYYGIDEIKVIRKAVAEHIQRQLEENAGKRREYEARRKERLMLERGNQRLRPVNN